MIPVELTRLKQWVCVGSNRIPLNPLTGLPADPTDPSTWGSYDQARERTPLVGFVLTADDPYTIIDLDDKEHNPCTLEELERYGQMIDAFQSYTERSASGRGYHIIIKGAIPGGARRDKVEVYSSARYMICTGDVLLDLPIAERQDLLDQLYAEMAPTACGHLTSDRSELMPDEEVLDMARNAVNGAKFEALCRGEWEGLGYPSQSEADFALMSILAFYSPNDEQCRRLFRMSALGRRPKAQRNDKYLNYALGKIRQVQFTPDVDFTQLEVTPPPPPPVVIPQASLTLPPGLVGEIANYIYSTAIRPVPEVALAGALACVAGICGRSYNISGTGLNQYLILLARTGTGKEGASTGIDNLFAAVRPNVPVIDQFLGPRSFASGPALVRTLDERPCFLSILGEFGITLQQLCDPRANTADKTLKKMLLDLYAKSGWNKILQSSAYSDQQKNTKIVQAPNVTILGESTPETFFEGLNTSHIAEGLVPRFCVIEYTGKRPPRNKNAGGAPSPELVQRVSELVMISLTTAANLTCAEVAIDSAAAVLLDDFDVLCDNKINSNAGSVDSQIWNRAHLKALKLAALLAVGVNPHAPLVTKELARWAITFVEADSETVLHRFQTGDVGVGEQKQENELCRIINDYLRKDFDKVKGYGIPEELHRDHVIPYDYLRRRARTISAIQNDRRGATKALKEMLADMVSAGMLIQVPPLQVHQRYNRRAAMYVKGEAW